MSEFSRQAAMGAVIAAFLALAGPDSGVADSQSAMQRETNSGLLQRIALTSEPIASAALLICGSSSRSAPRMSETNAFLTAAFQSCGDRVLTNALDTFADVVSRLK